MFFRPEPCMGRQGHFDWLGVKCAPPSASPAKSNLVRTRLPGLERRLYSARWSRAPWLDQALQCPYCRSYRLRKRHPPRSPGAAPQSRRPLWRPSSRPPGTVRSAHACTTSRRRLRPGRSSYGSGTAGVTEASGDAVLCGVGLAIWTVSQGTSFKSSTKMA